MAYEKKISVKKGGVGAIDGIIAGAVTTVVVGVLKQYITDMDPATENQIAAAVGVAVSAVVVAAKRFFDNWRKHRKDDK